MAIPPVLRSLLTTTGPSGYEAAPAPAWREAASSFATEVTSDVMGSSWARVAGTAGGPRLAVVGHIDEIGLIVTHIDDDGFLRFTGVGGWDPQILVGQRVELATKDGTVPGVIGKKPIHLLRDEERKKVAEIRELHIDVGAAGGDAARELVRVGDVAVISGEPIELPDDRVVSRSMDNRLGCFVAYEAGAARGRGRRRARRRRRRRRRPGGDDVRRRGDHRLRAAPRRGDRRRRHPRHRRARHRRRRAGQAPVRLGAGHRARLEPQPARLRGPVRDRARRRSRSRWPPPAATRAPTPTPCTSAAAASRSGS